MKKVAILVCICFSLTINPIEKNDLTKENIKGKVKVITEYSYSAIDRYGEIQKDKLIYKSIDSYNEVGNKTSSIAYNSDGGLTSKYFFTYNNKNELTESDFYLSRGILYSKDLYKYDSRGRNTEQICYNSNGNLETKTIYKYDEKGNKIEESNYNNEGALRYKYLYKFNISGYKVEEKLYLPVDRSKDGKITYSYDSKGCVLAVLAYNSEGILNEKGTFQYFNFDKNENWLTKHSYIQKNADGISMISHITIREIEYY